METLEAIFARHMHDRHFRISRDIVLALTILARSPTPLEERELAESVQFNKGLSGNGDLTRFRSALYWLKRHGVLMHCYHQGRPKVRFQRDTGDPVGKQILEKVRAMQKHEETSPE